MKRSRRYALPEMPKTVLVTGAAKRLGRIIAERLAQDGWAVAVHFNNSADDAADLVAQIEAAGGTAAPFQADLQDESATAILMDRVTDTLGPVGALVNNASAFVYDDVKGADRDGWDLHMEVNLRAPFVLTQGLARLLPADRRGHVINIIDERVWNLTPYFMTYTISKFGLWGITQTLALALAPRIQVNGIGPGPTIQGVRQTDAHFEQQNKDMPLHHGAEPEEIADTVIYLLSMPSVTGTMITVDGGQHLGWAQPEQKINPLD